MRIKGSGVSHIIVVGNEKGGSGKSTTCMHVATALARLGFRVAALDLDLRQQSFTRYLENRAAFARRTQIRLPMPVLGRIATGESDSEGDRVNDAIDALERSSDFIVVDCPGAYSRISEVAHSLGDTLVTPLNDSFVDFDLLARFDPASNKVSGPSVYSEMVWKARQARAHQGLPPIDWVVIRNRLGPQNMHNKRRLGDALTDLSRRIGFRVASGFGERVIFREMFPNGLTLLDMRDTGLGGLSLSNIAARQELRDLIKALNLPDVIVKF